MFNPDIKFEMSTITCNEEVKGNAKCKKILVLSHPLGDLGPGVTQRVHLCPAAKDGMVGGGSGVWLVDSLIKTGKLSHGEKWMKQSDGAREESEEVVTKLGMWFCCR